MRNLSIVPLCYLPKYFTCTSSSKYRKLHMDLYTYASLYLSESRRLGTRSNPLFLQSKRLLLISHFLETWLPSAGEWRRQTTSKTTNANIVNTLIKEQPHGVYQQPRQPREVFRSHRLWLHCDVTRVSLTTNLGPRRFAVPVSKVGTGKDNPEMPCETRGMIDVHRQQYN